MSPESPKRQLALDTDWVTALVAGFVWLGVLIIVLVNVVLLISNGRFVLSIANATKASEVGLPHRVFSWDTFNLLCTAFAMWACWMYMRMKISKLVRIVAGVLLFDLGFSILGRLAPLPSPLLWAQYFFSILTWIALIGLALIGIPLWLRSKIRYV